MSPREVGSRGTQFLRQRSDGVRSRLGSRWSASIKKTSLRSPQFFFGTQDIAALVESLHMHLPATAAEIVVRAERICSHKFDLLGYSAVEYGERINWHLDAVHGKQAPRKVWFKVPIFDFDQVGDPKVTWELNRHQHLVILAKAALLANNDKFLGELATQWYRWQEQNPYPIGINWASSLELAFRSISWLWVRALVGQSPALPDQFQQDLLHALATHGMHIQHYLSTYSSPNTHLLGEGVGLFFIGTLCPEIKSAEQWQKLGWETVLDAAHKQVLPDGMHFEQSTYYHVYALDFFLHARILAARNGYTIPAHFDEAIQRMLTVLRALCECGDPPRFGDDDGGRVFDGRRNRAEHLADPLATGAVLFQRGDLKRIARTLREETLWLLGVDKCSNFDSLAVDAPTHKSMTAFSHSGTYILRDGNKQLVVDAGPQGTGNSGHGHADSLSVTYASDGQEWLIDPGTYSYVASGRDLLRGTSAHNTIAIDGVSQAIEAGPFAWHRLPQSKMESCVQGAGIGLLKASHSGYIRLAHPVTHQRWVVQIANTFSMIRDFVDGEGTHRIDSFWHCVPEAELVKLTTSAFQICRHGRNGPTLLALQDHDPQPTCGWFSAAYGMKTTIPVLRISTETAVPAELAILILDGVQDSHVGKLSTGATDTIRYYRYVTQTREHRMFFSARTAAWRALNVESDCEFCYFCFDESGSASHVFACNASRLELNGKTVFAGKKIRWFEWKVSDGNPQVFQYEAPDDEIPKVGSQLEQELVASLGKEKA